MKWLMAITGFLVADAALAEDTFFSSPSKNIMCMGVAENGENFVRCDIMEMTSQTSGQKRPADCNLDWGQSFGVAAKGKGELGCVGDTVATANPAIVNYGSTITIGSITCTSAKTGLTCKNEAGGGFMLSRAKQQVF